MPRICPTTIYIHPRCHLARAKLRKVAVIIVKGGKQLWTYCVDEGRPTIRQEAPLLFHELNPARWSAWIMVS